MSTSTPVPLKPERLNPTDRAILDALHGGRCTPAYIADKAGYTTGNVRNRMALLSSHGHVNGLGGGLYELVDDPRGPTDDEAARDGVEDSDTLSDALDALDRALSELPEGTPGRTAVEDARALLLRAIDE